MKKKKLFVILSRVPWPLEKGDKLRAYHQLLALRKEFEIILCCINDSPLHPEAKAKLAEISNHVYIFPLKRSAVIWQLFSALFSNLPFQVAYFYNSGIHRQIRSLIKTHRPSHIYCQLIRTAEYAKHQHTYQKTLDYQDAFSKGMERRLNQGPWYLKWLYQMEAKRLTIYENLIFEYFENKTIISAQDRDYIMHNQRKQIRVVPNGVDVNFFCPRKNPKKYDLVFTGNMSYAPNIDSARFLVKQVMPLLWKLTPNATLLLAGANPHREVLQLAGKNVTVSGWMDDIREAYASAKIFVAPMQLGSGLQNKLLEAMAMEMPCVTSPLANNALGAKPGIEIEIAENAKSCAEVIWKLLSEPEKANELARHARRYIQENFDWGKASEVLLEVIEKSEAATSPLE